MSATLTNHDFKHVIDHLLEGCQIISSDWRYLYVNDTVARHGRKEKDQLIGRKMMDVYPGIDNTPVFKVLTECMETGKPAKMLNQFVHEDGLTGWFELSIQPIPEGIFILSLDVTEQKRTEARIETQLKRLATLHTIDLSILGTTDMRLALKTILEETKARLEADIVQVQLFNPHTLVLETAATLGHFHKDIERIAVRLGEGIVGKAALNRRTVTVPKLADTEPSGRFKSALLKENAQSIYSTPLIAKGELIGVFNVMLRTPFDASPEWLDFFQTLAGQTAMAIMSAKFCETLQRTNVDLKMAYDTTIEGWSRALDLRDKETEGHTQRVTQKTLTLARMAGIKDEELVHVRRGALLHDIGKMGVPDGILLKPGKLTDEEWVIMRKHPTFAYELLSPISFLHPALDIPYCHHEKWDGTGYPRGLKGEQIPLSARLFAVVDVWDALRSDRPYRQGWPEDKVREHIRSLSGTHFDPLAVELFLASDDSDFDQLSEPFLLPH